MGKRRTCEQLKVAEGFQTILMLCCSVPLHNTLPDSSPLTLTVGPKQIRSVTNASSKYSPSRSGIQKGRMPADSMDGSLANSAKRAKLVPKDPNISESKGREQDSTLSPFLCAPLDILFEVHIQRSRPASYDAYSHTTDIWVLRTRRPTYTCTHLLAATAPAVVAQNYVHLEECTPKVRASA
jgi:hypothetical protein